MDRIKTKLYKMLRWSERHTKTDMVYLARGGFWLTLGQIVATASSFLLAIAFANLLPKEVFGTYKFVLSMASLLAIPTLAGMNTALVRSVARGRGGTLIPALKTKIHWGILGGIGSLGVAGYYWINGNAELTISFLVIAAFIPLMDSFSIYGAYLQGKKKFKTSTKYFAITQIISVALLITTLFLTDNLFIILLAYFIPYTLLRSLFLRKTIRNAHPEEQDLSALPYGKHLSLMGVIGTIAGQLDKILLFHFLGPAEVAIYSFAIAIPNQVKGPLKGLNSLVLPKFAERDEEEIRKGAKNKFLWLFGATSLLVIVYVLIAPFIFDIFFPQYTDSIFPSQLFSVSIIAMSYAPFDIFHAAKRKLPQQYIGNIAVSIFQIITVIPLVIYFGIIGVVIARILHRFFGGFMGFYLFKKYKNE